MDNSLGAFIRDWEPPQFGRTFLDRYLLLDGKIEDTHARTATIGNENYLTELETHFSRLESNLNNWEKPFVNLVFGNVQSGKTSHLRANICWARDKNFDLMILLTGSNTDLGDQTVDTLETKLPTGTIKLFKSPTEGSLTADKKNEIKNATSSRITNRDNPVPLITLIKSPKRLEAVKSILEYLADSNLPDLKVLILDDEADQVSPDADANKRQVIESGVNDNDKKLKQSVHDRINEIRYSIRGIHIYLAYTATPQALFLGDLNSTMQPRFCSIVPPGEAYVGISDYVRKQSSSRSTFFQIITDTSAATDEQNYIALEKSFVTFVYLMWLHKHHSSIFHGSDSQSGSKCGSSSIQFLIHPSGKSDYHQEYADAVEQLRKDFKRSMSNSGRDRTEFFENFFKPTVMSIADQLQKEKLFLLNEENLKSSWEYFFSVLDDTNALHTKLVNHKERQRQQNESSSRRVSLVPISHDEWNVDGRDGWILVGGNILGRGLAIPHLVTTLFLRNPRHPNFDTSVQQMRFCGYRRNYLDLVRIFAPTDIIEDYQTAVEIDAPFRNRALRWHRESRDLLKTPPIMRFIAPSNSRYRPSRNGVISSQVSSRTTTPKSGFFNVSHIANPNFFSNNLDLVIDIAQNLELVEKRTIGINQIHYFALNLAMRKRLLSQLSIYSGEKQDVLALDELMDYSEEEKGLLNYDHLLAVDKATLDLISSEDTFRNFKPAHDSRFGFRTLNQDCHSKDWVAKNETMELRHCAAKNIVGDSERGVHDLVPNSVLIHARTFNLRTPKDESTIGMGLALVGWLPKSENDFQIYSNEDAINAYR